MAEAAGWRRGLTRAVGLILTGLALADVVALLVLPSALDMTTVAATVRSASARTVSAHAARVYLSIDFSGGTAGAHNSFGEAFGGVVDFTNHELDVTAVSGPVSGVEVRSVGGRVYEQLPAGAGAIRGINTPWVSIPVPASPTSGATGTAPTGDPAATLTQLEALSAGSIIGATEVGSESVRGIDTTRYDLQLNLSALQSLGDLAQASEGLSTSTQIRSAQIQVWIDGQGLLRRERLVFDGTARAPTLTTPVTVQSTVTIEPYDFGTPVDVHAPPADQVTDLPNLGALVNPEAPSAPA
ncbi:MAG TPA: hypothetical protein VGR90_08450 [Acidimicrobiales bacterium]|nr:hypothetical protein [Acidimicrobiales bacterium]